MPKTYFVHGQITSYRIIHRLYVLYFVLCVFIYIAYVIYISKMFLVHFPSLIFPFHLSTPPMRSTGFSFNILSGLPTIFIFSSSNKNLFSNEVACNQQSVFKNKLARLSITTNHQTYSVRETGIFRHHGGPIETTL